LIWGRINGLTGARGYCFASNEWLGKQLGLTKGTTSNLVSSLVDKGLLEREVKRDKDNKIIERRLFPLSINQHRGINSIMDRGINATIEGSNREKKEKKEKKENTIAKRKIEKFPKVDYVLVLNAYQKYKGVKLSGPEFLVPMRAIKTMFKAKRKPEEIISFMRWLNENEEVIPWVRTWTIWTVQKKIAEFSAGKLEVIKKDDSTPL